jgi:hypothetical protein
MVMPNTHILVSITSTTKLHSKNIKENETKKKRKRFHLIFDPNIFCTWIDLIIYVPN